MPLKTRFQYISLILSLICVNSFSQTSEKSLHSDEKKDSAGLKYFPLSVSNTDYATISLTTWNNERVAKPVRIGTEISGPFYFPDYPWMESYGISLAIYAGSSFSQEIRITGYVESASINHTYNYNSMEYGGSDTFMYYAPGISLYSKSRKFSFDLYRQLSSQPIISGKQQSAPFKANFHF